MKLIVVYGFIVFLVRAGTGGDEAGIWAGDLVGTCFSCHSIYMMY